MINPLNAKLNPICHLLALLGAHHILHVSRVRVKLICAVWTTCVGGENCAFFYKVEDGESRLIGVIRRTLFLYHTANFP